MPKINLNFSANRKKVKDLRSWNRILSPILTTTSQKKSKSTPKTDELNHIKLEYTSKSLGKHDPTIMRWTLKRRHANPEECLTFGPWDRSTGKTATERHYITCLVFVWLRSASSLLSCTRSVFRMAQRKAKRCCFFEFIYTHICMYTPFFCSQHRTRGCISLFIRLSSLAGDLKWSEGLKNECAMDNAKHQYNFYVCRVRAEQKGERNEQQQIQVESV